MKDNNKILLQSSINSLGEMKINSRQSVANMSASIVSISLSNTLKNAESKGDPEPIKKIKVFLNNIINRIFNAFSFRKNYYKEINESDVLVNENGDAIVTHEEKYISTL